MRPLGIIALGVATAIAASCGARTPFDDVEPPSGTSGPSSGVGSTGAGSSDTSTTGPSGTSGTSDTSGTSVAATSGTGIIPTTGSSGTGSSGATSGVTTVTTGGPGTGPVTTTVTTTFGSASVSVGSTGAGGAFPTGGVTTGGTGGIGGSTGAGGSVIIRDAGPPVEAGVTNPLLGVLPGVRQTPACNQCVSNRCSNAVQCSGNPACVASVACYFANCQSLNGQGQQLACATKCFNGDFSLLTNAIGAVSCVYGTCGPACGRPPRPN